MLLAKFKKHLLAPLLYEGSTTGAWFAKWLKECLFPELPARAVVVMDNAAFHKTSEVKEVFEASEFKLLYLPPYSPDLNPIEKIFAIFKKRRQYLPHDTTLDCIISSNKPICK